MNHPPYDPDSIAHDAAVLLAAIVSREDTRTGLSDLQCDNAIRGALHLHRLAWEACLPLNRPAPSPTHGPGVADLAQMMQALRDLGVRPVTREDDDGA